MHDEREHKRQRDRQKDDGEMRNAERLEDMLWTHRKIDI